MASEQDLIPPVYHNVCENDVDQEQNLQANEEVDNSEQQKPSYIGLAAIMDPTRFMRNNYSEEKNKHFRDVETSKELYSVCYKRAKSFLSGHGRSTYFSLASELRDAGVNDINTELNGSLGVIDYLAVVTSLSLASIMLNNWFLRKEQESSDREAAWKALRVLWNIVVRYPIGIVATAVEFALGWVRELVFPLLIVMTSLVWFPICKAIWNKTRPYDAQVNHINIPQEQQLEENNHHEQNDGNDGQVDTNARPLYQQAPGGVDQDDHDGVTSYGGVAPVQYGG